MDGIEKIRQKLAEIKEIIDADFPGYTDCSLAVDTDDYISVVITKWEKPIRSTVEQAKRRALFDKSFYEGKWSEERSVRQNEYYARLGVLLEEE